MDLKVGSNESEESLGDKLSFGRGESDICCASYSTASQLVSIWMFLCYSAGGKSQFFWER